MRLSSPFKLWAHIQRTKGAKRWIGRGHTSAGIGGKARCTRSHRNNIRALHGKLLGARWSKSKAEHLRRRRVAQSVLRVDFRNSVVSKGPVDAVLGSAGERRRSFFSSVQIPLDCSDALRRIEIAWRIESECWDGTNVRLCNPVARLSQIEWKRGVNVSFRAFGCSTPDSVSHARFLGAYDGNTGTRTDCDKIETRDPWLLRNWRWSRPRKR
jgi:hypothetical protein